MKKLQQEKKLQQVMKLIEMKADVNCTDFSGKRPLHVAVAHGHEDIAKLLLDNGAGSQILFCVFSMDYSKWD
jgi:ankyrin repeat protein